MLLNEALHLIAFHGDFDPDQLIDYASEDEVSGCEDGYFSPISVTRNEGKILYALVRVMRPHRIIEVGCHSGCSTTHMLSALERNRYGKILSIDFYGMVLPGIPRDLSYRWSEKRIDAREYQWQVGEADMVFEDGDHTRDLTEKVVRAAVEHDTKIVIAHDAYNENVGPEVVAGFEAGAGSCHTLLLDGPRLGLAYWFRGK